MDDVRKKGSGTWDRTQNRWELKRLGIRKTAKQLADILGEPVPEGKSSLNNKLVNIIVPFWERWCSSIPHEIDA